MSKYECKICNYITKEKSNLNRHNKSIKHVRNINISTNLITSPQFSSHTPPIHLPYTSFESTNFIEKPINSTEKPINSTEKPIKSIEKCSYCSREFTRYDNLGRHLKSCLKKKQLYGENSDKLQELLNKIKLLETNNEHYMRETEHYKAETNHYKQMLREAGGLVKKSVSSLTYAMDNYNTAPALKTIAVKEIGCFDNTEKCIVEDILSAYKHKTVGKYLGDIIIKIYKKDNPKSQSIWNTDDSRLTYLIKELVYNDSSNWIIDKKGIKTNTYLIEPLLAHVKTLLISYQTNFSIPDLKNNSIEMEFILDNSKRIIELINDIDDGLIGKDILKHISSHLRFSTKLTE